MPQIRGADIVVRALERAGCSSLFSLSGNHIMPIFDALLGSKLRLVHVRHEAAAVHMADAWARLTGQCGFALVSGGAGHANAVAALATAEAACSPLVLLSGHAPLKEIGHGAFQEMRQAEMAAPVTKAAFTVTNLAALGHEIARAVRTALSGRPGPVHVSLPFDLMDATTEVHPTLLPGPEDLAPAISPLSAADAEAVLGLVKAAARPLILAGPMLCHATGPDLMAALGETTGAPSIALESPRGLNDPRLGAFVEILRQADLIVLIGKALDFTLRFGATTAIDQQCTFVGLDPDPGMLARLRRQLGARLLRDGVADPAAAAATLAALAGAPTPPSTWCERVAAALAYRPTAWETLASERPGKLHPVELCRALAPHLGPHSKAVLVCDGGEIGQWPQALLTPPRRLINGVAGAIGASLPFAIAARIAEPAAPVIAVLGDGSFGFHMAEFDTAVRYGLPFLAVVGNDAAWNAERQIQLRDYGPERSHGCRLLPARYDLVAAALGGHGELVRDAPELAPALRRALASGKPACVNVMIESVPAPSYKR